MTLTYMRRSVQHLRGFYGLRIHMVNLEQSFFSPIALPRINPICSRWSHSTITSLQNRPLSQRRVNSFVPIGGYYLPRNCITYPCRTLPTTYYGATVFSVNWSIRPEMGSQQTEAGIAFCGDQSCRIQRSFFSSWSC